MQRIVIISKNSDFSAILAEAVSRELAYTTEVIDSMEEKIVAGAAAVVTTEPPSAGISVPVVAIAEKDKPLRLNALLAEIQRAAGKKNSTMRLGGEYVFSPRQKKVMHAPSGKAVALTDKEAQLIAMLAGGETVAKEALLKAIWGVANEIESHRLETHIYRLRNKLTRIGMGDAVKAESGGYALKVR